MFFTQTQKSKKTVKNSDDGLIILILGCILPEINIQIFKIIDKCNLADLSKVTFYVKEHPSCPIKFSFNPKISFIKSNLPLEELFEKCDVVLTGGGTSGAVDAYCYGLGVFQVILPNFFNLCPLRGLPGVNYINDENDFQFILNNQNIISISNRVKYFYLDRRLLNWKSLFDF